MKTYIGWKLQKANEDICIKENVAKLLKQDSKIKNTRIECCFNNRFSRWNEHE